jgi:ribosomal protein S18 acetylase RimI-like enzyme
VIDVVDIEAVREVTLDLTAAFARLLPLLSRSSPPPTADELAEIVAHPGSTLFVARLDDQIVGTLTLVIFRIPTGVRAWIEDVIVDEAFGGRGIGKALTKAAIDHAASVGVRSVDLTSRPSREVANGMYKRLGFEMRETNVYRYSGQENGRG